MKKHCSYIDSKHLKVGIHSYASHGNKLQPRNKQYDVAYFVRAIMHVVSYEK